MFVCLLSVCQVGSRKVGRWCQKMLVLSLVSGKCEVNIGLWPVRSFHMTDFSTVVCELPCLCVQIKRSTNIYPFFPRLQIKLGLK